MRPLGVLLFAFAVLALMFIPLTQAEACHGVALVQPIQAIGVQHHAVAVQQVAVPVVQQQLIRQRVIQRQRVRPIIQRQRIVQRVRGFCEASDTLQNIKHLANKERIESIDFAKFDRSTPLIEPTAQIAASP